MTGDQFSVSVQGHKFTVVDQFMKDNKAPIFKATFHANGAAKQFKVAPGHFKLQKASGDWVTFDTTLVNDFFFDANGFFEHYEYIPRSL